MICIKARSFVGERHFGEQALGGRSASSVDSRRQEPAREPSSGRFENLECCFYDQAFDCCAVGFHVRGDKVGFEMRNAFPLLHDGHNVGTRCYLRSDIGDFVHRWPVFNASVLGVDKGGQLPELGQKGLALSRMQLDRGDDVNHEGRLRARVTRIVEQKPNDKRRIDLFEPSVSPESRGNPEPIRGGETWEVPQALEATSRSYLDVNPGPFQKYLTK